MKKFVFIVVGILMVFSLMSCANNEIVDTSANNNAELNSDPIQSDLTSETQTISDEHTVTDTDSDESNNDAATSNTNSITNSNTEQTSDPIASSNQSSNTDTTIDTSTNTNSADNSTSSIVTDNTADNSTSDTVDEGDNADNFESLKDVNNGVLKEASPETMEVPENMMLLGTENAIQEKNSVCINATAVLYKLDGNVVNWTTENDFIYVITSGNNRLVVIDSISMSPVYNVPLAAPPAEMNIIGDKIYISFPDLCRIDIFTKINCEKVSSLYFDQEVSSFCLDGDYIYYSEHSQFCKVFKKNLITNELTIVPNGTHNTFYFPKLYLNKEDRILYIGETHTSGSVLYYYDADTLALKSVFKKDDYGINNITREIFHIGNDIFWGNYRLSDTNAKELIGKYGTASYGSVVFVSEELVSTYEGLFLTETYECVINYFDAGFGFEHILVSESYNVFFRRRSIDTNIIIGINFNLQ